MGIISLEVVCVGSSVDGKAQQITHLAVAQYVIFQAKAMPLGRVVLYRAETPSEQNKRFVNHNLLEEPEEFREVLLDHVDKIPYFP